MRPIRFTKFEGLGNDFIVIGAGGEDDLPDGVAEELCDRRRGIGADGVLLVLPPREVPCVARMKVINADGSVPEMCGNGLRCVALHLARARGRRERSLAIDTDAGVRVCTIDDAVGDARGEALVTVDMGGVEVLGDSTVAVGSERIVVTIASVGNPHAVIFGERSRADVDRLGPAIAQHVDFARGTNVEFANIANDGAIDLVVWERGVGVTLACGTGACATAAVACEREKLPRGTPIRVRLPGGILDVTIERGGRAILRGPARQVFSGSVDIATSA